jgi:hypothetical protein
MRKYTKEHEMTFSYLSRVIAMTAVVGLAAGGLAAGGAAPAHAAVQRCSSGVPGDVNGDGYAEVAVSATSLAPVHIFYGRPTGLVVSASGTALDDQQFTIAQLGVPEVLGATSTTFGDLNGDGCADLALSSPEIGPYRVITVLFGSPTGLSISGKQQFETSEIEPRGEFSDLVPSAMVTADFSGDDIDDLAVGMSDAFDDLSDNGGQGAVLVFFGSAGGVSADRLLKLGMQTPGASIGCWCGFGSGLAAGDFDGNGTADLAVSGPYNYDSLIQVLEFSGTRLSSTQPAALNATDQGAPTALHDPDISVGQHLTAGDLNADGRDDLVSDYVGGVVTLLGSSKSLTWKGSRAFSLTSLGFRDASGIASSLSVAPLDGHKGEDLVVGVAYAKVGSVKNAGQVTFVPGGSKGLRTAGLVKLTEATRHVPGSAEKGDGFGESVTTARIQNARQATLVVGAPGEEVSGHAGAGRIYQFPRAASGPKAKGSKAFSLDTAGVKGSTTRTPHFGTELSR